MLKSKWMIGASIVLAFAVGYGVGKHTDKKPTKDVVLILCGAKAGITDDKPITPSQFLMFTECVDANNY